MRNDVISVGDWVRVYRRGKYQFARVVKTMYRRITVRYHDKTTETLSVNVVKLVPAGSFDAEGWEV